MERIFMVRHGKAELSGTKPDKERALTPEGCTKVLELGQMLREKFDFSPDLVVHSGAVRTAATAFLLAGEVHTVELPELRLMGVYEHRITRDIVLSHGEGATFRILLAADAQGIWMSHAKKVAELIHKIISESDAHQVLVVGHENISVIGMVLLGWKAELLLDRPFGVAEGFMIDEYNNTVTRIAKDSP